MFKKSILFLLIPIISIVLSSCYLFPKEEQILAPPLIEPAEITYSVIEVERGNIERKLTSYGSFVSIDQSNVFYEGTSGRIESVDVAIGDEVEQGQILARLETGNLESRIRIQELSHRKVEIAYERAVETNADKYSLELAKIDLELADIALESLKNELERSILRAPISGNAVYVDSRVREGDWVNEFQTLVRIADPNNLQLECSGSGISEFKTGMMVDVEIGEETYSGKVVSTPADVPYGGDENLKKVIRIDVDDPPDTVKLGDNANVSYTIEKSEDTIVLPKQVIRTFVNRKYVMLLEDGLRVERDIETGIETATQVEILSGLSEGEVVIVR
jgi:membrane fusion protein, macrolide-specific efflux system